MKKLWSIYKKYQEAIDYLFWGGVAFVLSIVLFWVFTTDLLSFKWGEVFANSVDWVICVLFAFFTNKFFVFRSKSASLKAFGKEFVEFVAARVFTLILEDVIIWVGCSLMGYDGAIGKLVVKLIGQFVVIVTNYFLSKFWIFKDDKKKKDVEVAEAVEASRE